MLLVGRVASNARLILRHMFFRWWFRITIPTTCCWSEFAQVVGKSKASYNIYIYKCLNFMISINILHGQYVPILYQTISWRLVGAEISCQDLGSGEADPAVHHQNPLQTALWQDRFQHQRGDFDSPTARDFGISSLMSYMHMISFPFLGWV